MTYTVCRADDGDNAHSGLSLEEAADEMLSYDGRDWELRRDGEGWRIWNTYQNHARPWVSTRFYSAEENEAKARAELLAEVVGDKINRHLAMTDADYEAMMARIAAENAEDED